MESNLFEKTYRVHVHETGPDGKLNLYSLFDYMQDIASDQAEKLGFGRNDLLKNNHFWVLSRIYAVITELPLWEDSIIFKTWPYGTDTVFALRNYEADYPDGRHLVSVSSSWLILDRITKKIQRPGAVLTQYNQYLHSVNASVRIASKLEQAKEDGIISSSFRVRVSDLDMNLHTNNVKYLKWVCDTYTLDFVMKNIPLSVEINYLAESRFDEEIIIRTSVEKSNNNFYSHSITRTNDNKELCRIRIEWKETDNN
jgi:medium-chain acyl-[acyl-carrier-protein] hydrolase